MKGFIAVAIAVLLHSASGTAVKNVGVKFGPRSCVSLSRSPEGSCAFATDCEGSDISNTEFAFNCIGKGVVRHSFGFGGFDTSEEFDTDVKCERCDAATSPEVKPVAKKAAKAHDEAEAASHPAKVVVVTKATKQPNAAVPVNLNAHSSKAKASFWPFTSSKKEKKKTTKPEVVKYGPNGCVSVYKSEEGHCIMKTDCAKDELSNYEFGLVCVDKVGAPVKHLFGKDSFDKEETFDTLIKCNQCLGLEDVPDSVALAGEVVTMSKDIANLKDVMKNISMNVEMLNEEVFKPAAPAPAPAVPASPAAAVLVHHAVMHHRIKHVAKKHHLRHSHKHHHHKAQDNDDDEDEDAAREMRQKEREDEEEDED